MSGGQCWWLRILGVGSWALHQGFEGRILLVDKFFCLPPLPNLEGLSLLDCNSRHCYLPLGVLERAAACVGQAAAMGGGGSNRGTSTVLVAQIARKMVPTQGVSSLTRKNKSAAITKV